MKSVIQLINEGYNTTSSIQEQTEMPLSSLKRLLNTLIEDKQLTREGSGNQTTYRVLKSVPSIIDMLDKMRFYHQQKSMDFKYRKLDAKEKGDMILVWYIDNIPGQIRDYDENVLMNRITEASLQLDREISK